MGIEINRFRNPNQVGKFICNICLNVVDLEMTTSNCEHLFCNSCIEAHLETDTTCPKCRVTFEARNVPILIKQIIEELDVDCKFKCGSIIKYANIEQHEVRCFKRVCTIENGCNLNFFIEHNNLEGCIRNLKQFIIIGNMITTQYNNTFNTQLATFLSQTSPLYARPYGIFHNSTIPHPNLLFNCTKHPQTSLFPYRHLIPPLSPSEIDILSRQKQTIENFLSILANSAHAVPFDEDQPSTSGTQLKQIEN